MGATLKSANKNRVMDCVVEVEFYILRSSEAERERDRGDSSVTVLLLFFMINLIG